MTAQRITRAAAAVVAVPIAFALSTSQALATAGAVTADPVVVTNTETVQARLDASGKVEGARVYEQLALIGNGKVKLDNPVSTDGLRNLDGFGGFTVKDGKMTVDTSVHGEQRLRTVSDFDKKKLPITVAVTYTLNGKKLKKPGDAVGKKGRLAAHYLVENNSGKSQPVTITDGYGRKVTEQADVVIPMVGQLTTVLPPEFGDVQSNEANKAGDGKGGTKLSFTVTLFPPVGAATAEFGWSAEVDNAVVPEAELTALPVSPLDSPTFKTAVSGYQTGAEKGVDLVEGGGELDANLVKLREGGEKLLSGLLQLNAGAKTLNEGLAGKAAPGATQLTSGAAQLAGGLADLDTGASLLRTKTGEAAAGADKLNDGAGKLKAGAKELDAGAGKLQKGAKDLEGGAGRLQRGAKDLDAGAGKLKKGATDLDTGAGKLQVGAKDLDAGAGKLQVGAKDLDAGAGRLQAGAKDLDAGTGRLKAGTTKVNTGAVQLKAGTGTLAGGLDTATGAGPALITGLTQVSAGLKGVEDGLGLLYGGIGQLPEAAKPLHAGIQQLRGGIGSVNDSSTLLGGLQRIKQQLEASGPGIDKMRRGVDCLSDAVDAVSNGKPNKGYSEECYGAAAAVLNGPAGDANKGAEENAVKKMILDAALARMGSIGSGPGDLDEPLPSSATLQVALAYLKGRLTQRAVPGLEQLQCGLDNRVSGCPDAKPGLAQGLQAVDAGVSELVSSVVQDVQGAIGKADDTPADKTLRGGVNGLQAGVAQIQAGGTQLFAALEQLSDGASLIDLKMGELGTGIGQLDAGADGLVAGTQRLTVGTNDLAAGTKRLTTGTNDLAAGTKRLKTGTNDLAAGTKRLRSGSNELAGGMRRLSTGTNDLAAGTKRLRTGTNDLAAGTKRLGGGVGVLADGTGKLDDGLFLLSEGTAKLADGAGKAKDGSDKLAAGSKELSTGITAAAEGSGKLAEGLNTAAEGTKAIPEGARRLSTEGAQTLAKKGNETTLDFGRRYSMLSASAQRAKAESMPFGAPEGAVGATAYSLKLAGASGEGGRSWLRLLAGLAVFGLAIGATTVLRRRAA
ncbi:hypothetical protein HPO96_13775 [Kribbella sandramycini]|uniref:Putative membrane protein n=1 Tax=Kribbella sandramycini TaxID=60450 RepID=A0A7Y4KZ18_9ACTN|nr:putative membrane protein [Kribbella sandramycini]NOL41317.1 hypothetical protein [Kribbella sandramycini]